MQQQPTIRFHILPRTAFCIESHYSPAEVNFRVGKVTKADPEPAPYMPLKCYWGKHDRTMFRIAPLYRGDDRSEQVNDPALLYYHGTLQPYEAGTQINVQVRWSRGLLGFALSWYSMCATTLAILIIALRQTAELGQLDPSMLLLAVLPALMIALMYLPLFVYIRHHSEQQYRYLSALLQQESIPKYSI